MFSDTFPQVSVPVSSARLLSALLIRVEARGVCVLFSHLSLAGPRLPHHNESSSGHSLLSLLFLHHSFSSMESLRVRALGVARVTQPLVTRIPQASSPLLSIWCHLQPQYRFPPVLPQDLATLLQFCQGPNLPQPAHLLSTYARVTFFCSLH